MGTMPKMCMVTIIIIIPFSTTYFVHYKIVSCWIKKHVSFEGWYWREEQVRTMFEYYVEGSIKKTMKYYNGHWFCPWRLSNLEDIPLLHGNFIDLQNT